MESNRQCVYGTPYHTPRHRHWHTLIILCLIKSYPSFYNCPVFHTQLMINWWTDAIEECFFEWRHPVRFSMGEWQEQNVKINDRDKRRISDGPKTFFFFLDNLSNCSHTVSTRKYAENTTTQTSSGSTNVSNSSRCNTLDNPSCLHLQSLVAETSKLRTVLHSQSPNDHLSQLGCDPRSFWHQCQWDRQAHSDKLAPSWLGSLVLTRSNTFITKQWSTSQEDQGHEKPVIHKQRQRVFHNIPTFSAVTHFNCQ